MNEKNKENKENKENKINKTKKNTNKTKKKEYDIIIVGGGIAGLYMMYNVLLQRPDLKVLLLEKNERLGGRIYTHHETVDGIAYHMDLGAGRIGTHHRLVMNLIKRLGLEREIVPISDEKSYIEVTNGIPEDKSDLYEETMVKLRQFLKSLKINLTKHYVFGLCKKYVSKAFAATLGRVFEYKSDIYAFNAADAATYFTDQYAAKSSFFTMKDGIQSIIDALVQRIGIKKKTGFIIKTSAYVDDIQCDNGDYTVSYNNGNTGNTGNKAKAKAPHLVLALPRNDLSRFTILDSLHGLLDTINEIPLLRIYEIYPIEKGKGSWFSHIKKTVTNTRLQMVIPIDQKTGLIMSSYSDYKNAQHWLDLDKGRMKATLHRLLQEAFAMQIPQSKWLKFHYWPIGVAAWKRNVDSAAIGGQIVNPLPNLYICGENYSQYQAWIEGALETSEKVLSSLSLIKAKANKGGKTKKKGKGKGKVKISLTEVARHNKANDAWTVIDGKVYDITRWIPQHPGGNIILKALGRDATSLFNGIGHPDYVKKTILPKYYIAG